MVKKITITELINTLLDMDNPVPAKYIYRLSDLSDDDLAKIKAIWHQIPEWRRQALLEDTESMAADDTLLSFTALSKFALDDPDDHVRALAIQNLWESEDQTIVPKLLEMMSSDKSEEVRANAAYALGQFVYLGEIEELKENLLHQIEDQLISVYRGDDTLLVRRQALEALGYSSRPEVDDFLREAYSSGNRDLLASSLFAMGRSANSIWHPYVEKMLTHQDAEIRAEAARAAGELEAKSCRDLLLELVQDENEEVRQAAIWSLSEIGGEDIQDLFMNLYNSTDDDEELNFLEDALDNLAFTNDVGFFTLLDVAEEGELHYDDEDEDEIEIYLKDIEDLLDIDIDDEDKE